MYELIIVWVGNELKLFSFSEVMIGDSLDQGVKSMLSEDFISGMKYELQNRAFALRTIERIAVRVEGEPEHIFWSSYEKLEKFNTPCYAAYAKKLGLDTTPSSFTKAKASMISATPGILLDALLKLVYSKTQVYMQDLKKVRSLGPSEDNEFLNYMIAQEQVQIELMELAIKKRYGEIQPKIDSFIKHYQDKKLV